jgi:hypothetical protein
MLEAEKHSIGKDIYKFIDENFKKFRGLAKDKRKKDDRLEYQELVNEFSEKNERA